MSNENLKYDPNLKEAMQKIKGIIEEYDIGAHIVLTSKTHGEYLNHFPTWSIAQFNKEENGIDLKSKREDFSSVEEQKATNESSLFFLCSIRDTAARTYLVYEDVLERLSKIIDFEHTPFHDESPDFVS